MTILVAIDLSAVSASVINVVPELAKIEDVIHLLYVSEPNPEFVGFDIGPSSVNQQIDQEFKQQQRQLHKYAQTLEKQGYSVQIRQANGVIVNEIIDSAQKIDAKMIILGRHGHSAVYNVLVGSVAAAVLKHSPLPVVLVPQ
ncbi:universal stress protein [Colwelliaceae bacterium BS250]